MKKILTICLILMGLVGAANVVADECCYTNYNQNTGFYVGAIGGVNWLNIDDFKERTTVIVSDEDGSDTILSYQYPVSVHAKTGFMAGGVVGYKFCPVCSFGCVSLLPRVEAEFAYRYNQTSHIKVAGYKVKHKENLETMAYMANLLVDIDLGFCITPYIGGGIGYAHSWAKHGFKENRFAYQGIVGLSYALCDKIDFTVDYHFLKAVRHAQDHALCFGVKKYF